jgi:uncharacterized protein (TIGR03437 family)
VESSNGEGDKTNFVGSFTVKLRRVVINWRTTLLWRLLLMLPAAGAAFGWPYGDTSFFATNRDGSVLYFSSSLRMKGTTQYLHRKIFVWEAGKDIRLFEQRASDAPAGIPPAGWVGSEYFSLEGVDVSSDGSTVSLVGERACTSTACATLERWRTSVYAPGQKAITMPGAATLSRNGRFAVLSSSLGSGLVSQPVVDLQTGQRTNYIGWGISSGRVLANDGTFLLSTGAGLSLARGGQTTALNIPAFTGWINDAATLVVYLTNSQLLSYSVATRASTVLANLGASTLAMSDDGSVIAFGVYEQIFQTYVVRSDGTGLRKLTNFPEGARPVAMSGDGKVVFVITGSYATAGNRLVRIDVASGQGVDVVPPTLWLSGFGNAPELRVWPGALATLGVFGMTQETIEAQLPFPTSLAGVEMRINGSPAPIASVAPFEGVRFQIPWDLPQGYSELEILAPFLSASPFVAGAMVQRWPPEFFIRRDGRYGIIAAAHEDFGQMVSFANPAGIGEILHLYAQGLGPVSLVPPPGESAPLEPLSRLRLPPVCAFVGGYYDSSGTFVPTVDPADVLFAGLAPKMIGVYQIDLRIPAAIRSGLGNLTCLTSDPMPGKQLTGYIPIQAAAN